MYRDEQVAALERLARLEERVRELDPQQKKPFSKRAKVGICIRPPKRIPQGVLVRRESVAYAAHERSR